jgi:hypothetical protein
MSSASSSTLVAGLRRLGIPAALAAVLLMLFGISQPAHADDVSQIANGLSNSRLYVSTDAGNPLSASAQNEIRSALNNVDDADIYMVVTRSGVTQQQMGQMLQAVQQRVGRGDTYIGSTADGRTMGISERFSPTEINQLVTQASSSDLRTELVQFAGLADARAQEESRSSAITSFVILGVLVLLAFGVVALVLTARKRRRDREAQQMAELKDSVEEDVIRLGEDISALDLKVTDPKLDPDAREDYTRALDSYDEAKSAQQSAQRPEDMEKVTTALADGRYHMTACRARLAGDPVPERRAPCFFNPQHGPSTQDITWAPLGGQPRSVPACAEDAERVLRGDDPESRLVTVGGRRRPYWEAGPAYGPYAGGYYAGYGGVDLLSGMLIGTALGSMMFGGFGGGFGGYGDMGGGDMGGFGGDGGDIGGGWDFGSGDFGGGMDF